MQKTLGTGKAICMVHPQAVTDAVLRSGLTGQFCAGSGIAIGIVTAAEDMVVDFGNPIGTSDLVEIGSLTKVFTGILAGHAIIKGTLSLDTSLGESLFGCQGEGTFTLRSLLTHTSGLPRISVPWLSVLRGNPYSKYTREDLAKFLIKRACKRVEAQPFKYSNLGYAALGLLLERTCGKSYTQLLDQVVCKPLALDSICLDPRARSMRPGYGRAGLLVEPWTWDAYAPCGGLRGSLSALMSFVRAMLFETGLPRDLYVLSSKPISPSGRKVGLAWFFNADGTWRWHNGAAGGHSSYMAICTEKVVGLVVVATQNRPKEVTQIGEIARKYLAAAA